uniref:Uncharacterized protein n=1 Tax=Lepeophtheirus salmonis TaxID=72036 RepID=A0A0K2UBN0_LEPSM
MSPLFCRSYVAIFLHLNGYLFL